MNKKEVIAILKEEGLDIGEEAAVAVTRAVFKLIKIFVPLTSNGLGKIIVPLISVVEAPILEMLDKIDGKDDPGY